MEEYSETYRAVKAMLEMGWPLNPLPELDSFFQMLETKGMITSAEHKSLLELATQRAIQNQDELRP
jgi:hypothetical protein